MPDQQDKFRRFKALHDADRAFFIPNPWDAGSARLLTSLGTFTYAADAIPGSVVAGSCRRTSARTGSERRSAR